MVDTSPDEKLHHVVRGLYIGSQDAACNYDALRTAGITHILNVATGIAPPSHANEFKYTILEVLDVPESDMTLVCITYTIVYHLIILHMMTMHIMDDCIDITTK